MKTRKGRRHPSRSARNDAFDWSGGHPALDFVNTLDERPSGAPAETLRSYGDLVRFAELAGLIEPSAAAALRKRSGPECVRIVGRARGLREHLHSVLAATHAGRSMPPTDLHAIAAAI